MPNWRSSHITIYSDLKIEAYGYKYEEEYMQ